MAAYELVVRVSSEANLARAIGGVSAYGSIVSLRTVASPPNQSSSPAKKMVYAGNKRNKGIMGKDLLADLFKKKSVWTTTQIVDEFVAAGFSVNSASPRIADAKRHGLIKQDGQNTYKRM